MTTKIFLASSAELKEDRREFEILIGRKNKAWKRQGADLELIVWEDFLDAMSATRLQDEYNKAIRGCDIFVMLFFTKVGKYTVEEFDAAFGQFKATNRPVIYTYFKDAPVNTGSINIADVASLVAFKEKLQALGHFHTVYKNTEGLLFHFLQQLDKLAAAGFIAFNPSGGAAGSATASSISELAGDGAIAQGPGAQAVGARGVLVGGNNMGNINTGTQTTADTGGGAYVVGNVSAGGDFVGRDKITQGLSGQALESLFAPLLEAIAAQAPPASQPAAIEQAKQLQAEVAKGKHAEDGKVAKLVEGLVGLVPAAIGTVVSTFASPILGGVAGPVTKYVLDKLKGI